MENDEEFIFPDNIGILQIKGSMPSSGNMIVSRRGQVAIAISNGKYCVRKGYTDNDVTMDEDIENCKTKEIANPVSVQDINVTESSIALYIDETKTVIATVMPSNATIKTLKWSSLDENIVTVDNGIIKAIKKGTTTIKVETTDGSNINKTINVTVKEKIMTSVNNCIKNSTICPNGTLVNVKVNNSENCDFYVIKDTGSEVTLIMNQNLGDKTLWITQADYEAAGGTGWTSGSKNDKGPLTLLTSLEERTSDWSNIPSMTYTLTDDSGDNRYSPIIRNNVKSRLLSRTEAVSLGCAAYSSGSCPTYLTENYGSEGASGYWLSSINPSTTHQASILLSSESLGGIVIATATYGVRPVITVAKNL